MTLDRLKSLYDLIGRMNSVYKLSELLEFVVDQAISLTGGKRGLLLLSDGQSGQLEQVAVARGQELNRTELSHVQQFVSTTVIQDVLEQGEPRLVVDLSADQRYERRTSDATLTTKGVRSVLAVPLKTDENILVGLIYIDHPRRAVFGENDLDFLRAFAGQAAIAINRTKQHQRQIDELTQLNELSRSVVQALDLEQVLTRIVNQAIKMLNVETGSVLLLDDSETELYFATSVSRGRRIDIPTRLKKDQGLAGWVVTHAEPICITDVANDPRWFGEVETGFATRSLLCVPLQQNGRILGVLQALNKKNQHGFEEADIARLSAFASWATVAIQNARLFQQANQARRLSALNEVALALGSTLNLDTILQVGLARAIDLLRAKAGMIQLLDTGLVFNVAPTRVTRGFPPSVEQTEPQLQALRRLFDSSSDTVIDEPQVIDLHRLADTASLQSITAAGLSTIILIPLQMGSRTGGFLALLGDDTHQQTDKKDDLLISLTRIISLAIQNSLHYNQVRAQTRHLTYLNEVGSALTSSLELPRVLEVIIQGVNAMLETERTSVFLIDEQTNELVLRYSNSGDADIRLPAPWQGIAGWVATNDQPALVNDTMRDSRHLRQVAIETDYQAHSILCVPLKVQGRVIGVVEVLNKTDDQQFTAHHQILLSELTRWAAIAIHNARLYNERVQAYRRLTTEQERRIAAETRGAMAAVVLEMAHTMNNVVGAIRVWASQLEQTALNKPDLSLGAYQKELSRIRQNAEEAIRLISSMTGPLEQPRLIATDVHTCLSAAIKSCWWPDNATVQQTFAPNLPPVLADPKRLETVFQNLLSNAIHAFAAKAGEVRVSTHFNRAGQVQIVVCDNGPGIPADLQNQIFRPGVSGTEGGLGIGLWLAETFIQQFGGQIEFSSPGVPGACFTVTLQPATASDSPNVGSIATGQEI